MDTHSEKTVDFCLGVFWGPVCDYAFFRRAVDSLTGGRRGPRRPALPATEEAGAGD